MLKPGSYELLVFRSHTEECPYTEWLDSLDRKTMERVLSRVGRLKWGQFGDYKALDGGLYELRLFFGPGYRVYFAHDEGKIIVILGGGDKSTQSADIRWAGAAWKNYKEEKS